jgi:antirestriction protein ArdC
VTDRIVAELEAGRLPWVQPWDSAKAGAGMPCNAGTGRRYSGINVLILWATLFERGYSSQHWLTYKQAQNLGGNVRKGERGTTVCYADRFTPKDGEGAQPSALSDDERRSIAFLKRFTVFDVDQIEGLPADIEAAAGETIGEPELIPEIAGLIEATGANFRIGGDSAFYVPAQDFVCVPPQQAFADPVNWYPTALHELGHWTGHPSRLNRFECGKLKRDDYAREELVAEMCSAFACAELGIVPTVRHADYIGSWLSVPKNDNRAIFRAASKASKAADFLLAFRKEAAEPERVAA